MITGGWVNHLRMITGGLGVATADVVVAPHLGSPHLGSPHLGSPHLELIMRKWFCARPAAPETG
jgi:hypothetical protein